MTSAALEHLRFLLHSPPEELTRSMLLDAMEEGARTRPEEYRAVWLPYLEGMSLPIFQASTPAELERLGRLLPRSGKVELCFSEHHNQSSERVADKVRAFLRAEGLHLVTRVEIRGTQGGLFWPLVMACASHERLESVELRGGTLRSGDLAQLMSGPQARRLRAVRVYGGVQEEDLLALAESPHCGALQELDLGSCRPGQAGALALVSSPHLESLRSLRLSYGHLGGGLAAAMAAAWTLPALRELHLTRCELGDAGLEALTQQPLLRHVVRWGLSGNGLGPAAARALSHLDGEEGVEVLDLSSNELGPEGAKALAQWPRLVFETMLNISSNRIGDAGALALARLRCRHITSLHNQATPAARQAVSRLRGFLAEPRRHVYRFERQVIARTPPAP